MKDKKLINNSVVIYQTKSGSIELKTDLKNETVWITQKKMADIFNVDVRTINEHLGNIFKTRELVEKSVIRKFRITADDGKAYDTKHYNLDAIISVGYRVNSKTATEFRKWATKTLKSYITKGFVVNKSQIKNNYEAFMKTVGDIQNLLPDHVTLDPKAVLDLIREFAGTWVSLDAYDKDSLEKKGITKKNVKLTGEELTLAISELRNELIIKKEATELFAIEREKGGINGIVGNIMQSFGGKNLYDTLEEKAAHLLYFITKNHVFVDGNKRSAAFSFIWFLKKFKVKGFKNINPATLTALTLFIAESDPQKKDLMAGLILQILK